MRACEICADFSERSLVMVEGSISYGEYEKSGVTCKTTDIVIGRFDGKLELLGSKNDREESREPERRKDRDEPRTVTGSKYQSQLDDDIPF